MAATAGVVVCLALVHDGALDLLVRNIGAAARGSGSAGPFGAVGPTPGASRESDRDAGSLPGVTTGSSEDDRVAKYVTRKAISKLEGVVYERSPSSMADMIKRVKNAVKQVLGFNEPFIDELGQRVDEILQTGVITPEQRDAGAKDLEKAQEALTPERW